MSNKILRILMPRGHTKVHLLQRGKEDEAKKLIQHCMLCGKCTLVCPRGINIRKILLDITR